MICLIVGLPGTGKTALSSALANRFGTVVLDGDAVRADLSSDLGFGMDDRIEQARRIGAVARLLDAQGLAVFCSFICPTDSTRAAFGNADITVWMDRLSGRLFDDTSLMWEPPHADIVIRDGMTLDEEVDLVLQHLE